MTTILGLNEYDLLKRLALDKIKQATQKQLTLNAFEQKIAEEQEKANQVAVDKQRVDEELESIALEEQTIQKQIFLKKKQPRMPS